jgi:short-subunit dehydrogenase
VHLYHPSRAYHHEESFVQQYRGMLNRPRPDRPVENPKVVFVTGATSGIGKATALLLAALGHQVAVTGRREDRLAELKTESENLLGEILPLVVDVRDGVAMQKAAAEALAHYNRLDVLIANAGLGQRGLVVDSNWQEIETVLRTNIEGVLHSVRACVPPMRASGGGHIITISSVLGPIPAPGAATYSASKAAVDSYARALRTELKPDNIWVTNILVGQTHTEFSEKRLGESGRVASKLPTMTAEQVALQIVRAMERRKRTIILRWIDRFMVAGGTFFPWIADPILAKIYLKR